ncbi:MAG: STAS domain-containing protein [Chitinispirillaceae bacterium]
MKCYDIKGCSEECRESCFVYQNFRNNTAQMENISCWILKKGSCEGSSTKNCRVCPYYRKMNKNAITVDLGEHDTVVIECSGVLNSVRSDALRKVADRLRKVKKGRVIIDVSNVNNIYSCALGMIVRFYKQCSELGGRLVIVGAAGYVKVALTTARLDKFILMVDSKQEAFCAITQQMAKESIVDEETSETEIGLIQAAASETEDNDDDADDFECDTKFISMP